MAVERVRTSPSPEAPAGEPSLDEQPAPAEEPAPVEEAAPSEPDDPPPVPPTEEELAEMAAEMIKIEAEIVAECSIIAASCCGFTEPSESGTTRFTSGEAEAFLSREVRRENS